MASGYSAEDLDSGKSSLLSLGRRGWSSEKAVHWVLGLLGQLGWWWAQARGWLPWVQRAAWEDMALWQPTLLPTACRTCSGC